MNLILIGPPATGKGTQSSILSKFFNIPHISIGDIFRNLKKDKNNVLGKQVNSFIEKGLLVPDEITNEIISQYLSDPNNIKNGFILDGFPRNLNQAFFLSQEFKKKNIFLTKVIYFNSHEEFLKKRIIGRIICPLCGEIYHKEKKMPKKNGFCDNDGVTLVQRQDDNIETFTKRFLIYQKETFPLVEYYRKMGQILEIKVDIPNTSIDDITKMILKKIINPN